MKHMDFNVLYEKHAEQLYKFLLRLCGDTNLAEDLVQDTFLKAMERADAFDNRCKFTTWLCQIGKNLYIDYLRKNRRHPIVHMQDNESESKVFTIEEKIVADETAREIRRAVHRLSEPYKEVFLLRFYAELSFREIGQMFDKSEVWGRVTYLRSKDMIIRLMEQEEGAHGKKNSDGKER